MTRTIKAVFFLALAFPLLACITSVRADEDEDDAWPREIEREGYLVVLYQPQVDRLEGDNLYGRAAVSVTPAGQDVPTFGAAWIETRIATDLDNRIVTFRDVRVPRVRFPDATEEQAQGLVDLLTAEIPTWNLEIDLDRLAAMLEIADKKNLAAEGFNDAAPQILFSSEPAVLVTIDGPPQLRELEGTGLQAVVNTAFLVVQDPGGNDVYYLYAGGETWYTSTAVEGPWAVAKKVPKAVRNIEPEEEEAEDEEDDTQADKGPSTPPGIIVATEPTELIVTDGPPDYAPIAGSELLIVTNTESDMLIEVATQRTFVLLSGRWFAAPSTDGPWEFVRSDELPESFAAIDPDSDYGYLLTWVAGTDMAEETVLDAYVPQTAAIKRDASIEVTFDGEPRFEPIEDTNLLSAVNTESQVIQAGSTYYCAEQGVWYVAASPTGPWRVATEIPEEIYTIPPSNPNYNLTYVYIYDTTPEVVYVGYYPGYVNSYHYHGCLVYGTGWYYRPWWGPYHYYPRYSTWGFSVRYNPWYGWSFGLSYSTGRFTFRIGFGGWYRHGWWGPGGYRGYHRGYNRGWHRGYRQGRQAGYRAGYRSAQRDSARNLYQRSDNASRVAKTAGPGGGRSPGTASNRPNNVYADKNGNVFRQNQDGNWQQREGNQWKNTEMPEAGRSRAESAAGQREGANAADRQRPDSRDGQRPSSGEGQRPSTYDRQRSGDSARGGYDYAGRPSTADSARGSSDRYRGGGGQSLNRDSYSRQRGAQRSRSFNSSRSRGGRGGGRRR
jgi:hypothetical protein